MLESDIQNGETRLVAQFYKGALKNEWKTLQEGRPVHDEHDFVRIYVPGDSTTVIDRPVHDGDKQRFPIQWKHYENTQGGEAGMGGTPIEQWPILGRAQVEDLRAMKFYTVESIASASDQNIMRMGMLAGMSPYSFREKAQRFLQMATDSAVADKQAAEIAELRAQIKALQETPTRGRPRKQEETEA